MAEPTGTQETLAGSAGFIEHVRALAGWLAGYLQARLQLAGLESKEALLHYLQVLAWLLVGVAVVTFGYIFLCISLVFLLAYLFNVNWIWIMLGFGAVHFGIALVCLLMARSKLVTPMFSATISELKKDQEWLTTSAKPS